jgi:hypothetical protein
MSTPGQGTGASRYQRSIESLLSPPKENREFIIQCFWELKTEFDAYGKKIARWAVLGVAFICLFELINRKLVGQASISGVTISNLRFLLYILPPLVALSSLNLATFNVEQNIYRDVLGELAQQRFPELLKSQVLNLFLSQQGTFGAFMADSFSEPSISGTLKFSRSLQVGIVPACFLVFEIYAYFQLFMHSRSSDVLLAVIIGSLVLSAFMIVLAISLTGPIRNGKSWLRALKTLSVFRAAK